ncbi:MAG: hypothetical protein AAF921_13800 [Cyanobacteria bacterium P01_D01_bin.44]
MASLLASLMVLANGISAHARQPLRADVPLPYTLPGLVARRIQLDLARRLNVPVGNIMIGEATAQTWNDPCLGLASPNESCADRETKGWQVEVESWQQRWVYRSDRAARRLRLEPLPNSTDFNQRDFSAEVSQTLLETVSQQVQQPIESLQILEVQAATWDGCLGIAEPDTVCTQEAIPGFRVLVNDGPKEGIGNLQRDSWPDHREFQREWVYHLNEDATQIVQNTTASDTAGRVGSWFRRASAPPEELAPGVIFQTKAHDYLSEHLYITTLTADGTLSSEQISLDPGNRAASEVLSSSQISPEDAAAFERLLRQQNFSNLNQMEYSNEDQGFTMEGFVTLIAPGVSVEYTAAEEDLPVGLQVILEAWSGLGY